MKKIIPLILLYIFIPGVGQAEDLYYAQVTAGVGDGSDCSNAYAVADMQWGDGTGSISASDTAHLCGTISTPINVGQSGSGANTIVTIKFEDAAVMSKPSWGALGAAITISSKNYVLIDGGTNGIIEATDNGSAFSYSDDNRGVFIEGTNNVEVKNLTIRNLYVRTPGISAHDFKSNGVRSSDVSNLYIHDNTISYLNGGVYAAYAAGNENINIYDNIISHGANGIVVGNNGAVALSGCNIYGNTINLWDDASDDVCGNTYHNDGMQIFAVTVGSSISGIEIYANTIGPYMGTCTATTGWIFLEGDVSSKIYNNLTTLVSPHIAPDNGFIVPDGSAEVYNNTIISYGQKGTGIKESIGGDTIHNNIMVNLNTATYLEGVNALSYNAYYGNGSQLWPPADDPDTHKVTSDPLLDIHYRLMKGSPVIDAGISLSSLFSTDYDGIHRPQGLAWDIGASEYNGPRLGAPQLNKPLVE